MSDKLPVFSSKEFIRAAKRLDFEIKKGGKGSHTRLVYSKSRIILSVPKAKTISIGIRHQLLKNLEKINISRKKFIKLLSVGLLIYIKNIFNNLINLGITRLNIFTLKTICLICLICGFI